LMAQWLRTIGAGRERADIDLMRYLMQKV
jgi:hypothetical protein